MLSLALRPKASREGSRATLPRLVWGKRERDGWREPHKDVNLNSTFGLSCLAKEPWPLNLLTKSML